MKPWPLLVAGILVGVLGAWLVRPSPPPDTDALERARTAEVQAREKSHRDSLVIAALQDSLQVAHEHTEIVTTSSRLIASEASAKADSATVALHVVLDSLGASTEALDTLEAAHARQIEAKDAEIKALRNERAILFRRIEASDTLIASLTEQITRKDAVAREQQRLNEKLAGDLRAAKRREKIAEVVAVLALVNGAVR